MCSDRDGRDAELNDVAREIRIAEIQRRKARTSLDRSVRHLDNALTEPQ
ncbi:hypothetical protein [Nocardia nepalensis]